MLIIGETKKDAHIETGHISITIACKYLHEEEQ